MRQITLVDNQKQTVLDLGLDTFGQPNLGVSGFAESGWFCYDPGLTRTSACKSAITWLDGQQGRLLYRGYPIEQLAEHKTFTEVMHLLLHGQLPSTAQHQTFTTLLADAHCAPASTNALLLALPKTAHPMAIISTLLSHLSAQRFCAKDDYKNLETRQQAAYCLLASIPTQVALASLHSQGKTLDLNAYADMPYTARFAHQLLACGDDQPVSDVIIDALDKIFILHADHELNASTFTVRTAGSTGTNPYACANAGLGALWGPAHGGANEACLNMLQAIGDVQNIPHYIAKAKDKNDPFKLMGFGHRVYKNYDPRAKMMQQICHQVMDEMGHHNHPLFDLARELERVALEDPYFIEKKLYPNVDFYSGLTLRAMGIPTNVFTAIFALARMTGWMSHWLEMYQTEPFRITRPRQWYIGATQRDVTTSSEIKGSQTA